MGNNPDERLTQMEIRIAYQDRLLASLNEVVHEFAGRVQSLEEEVRTLRQSSALSQETGPHDEPPPHY